MITLKKILALFLATLTITGLLVFKYLSAVKEAEAFVSFTHRDWSGWSNCEPLSCGTYEGVQHRTCEFQLFGTDNCTLNEVEQRWCEVDQEDYFACEVEVCEDENALNYGKEEECVYPEPVPTPEPPVVRGLTPAGPPPAPACEKPTWAPTVTYLGQNGKTFSYKWTEVRDGLDTYWVDFGATKDNLLHSIVVQGESVDITMATENTNWMRVAGYDNGCLGPFSEVTN